MRSIVKTTLPRHPIRPDAADRPHGFILSRVVLWAAALLFVLWAGFNLSRFAAQPDALIRFVLGALFALLLIARAKPAVPARAAATGLRRPGVIPAIAVGGALLCVAGIVFRVHQAEWLGLLLVLFACVQWAMPSSHTRDISLAFLLLYWMHPLPGQAFGAMQLAMQRMSVAGAQWLLQVCNVRVWADGFVLRTGLDTFEVPAACSGMRSATTVFLLTLGLALLRRFRRRETVALVALAMFQALVLNVLRISVLIAFVPTGGGEANVRMLHDTTGVLILLASVLASVELSIWDHLRRRRRVRAGEFDLHQRLEVSHYPGWLGFFFQHRLALAGAVVVLVMVAGLVYKSRPSHRAEMVSAVIPNLRDAGNIDAALRALDAVEALVPQGPAGDLDRARMLLLKGDCEGALRLVRYVPADTEGVRVEIQIIRAFAFLGQQHVEEAGRIVAALPEYARRDPRVAMVMAELALVAGETDKVEDNVIVAARQRANRGRVRSMFPYLERHRRWDTILRADWKAPYSRIEEALAAASAHMHLNNVPAVADIMRQVTTRWPPDRRALIPLYFLARKLPGSEGEERYDQAFGQVVAELDDPDPLYDMFEQCFAMSRPDLAWRLFRRIEAIDPGHPGLLMATARFGDAWFLFRRQILGMPYQGTTETIDLEPHCIVVSPLSGWRIVREAVPLWSRMVGRPRVERRRAVLADAIAEFSARWQGGTLTPAMTFEYALALEMDNRRHEAVRILAQLGERFPRLADEARVATSEVYERQADWQSVYEVLRTYPDSESPQVTPLLRLTQAQVNLALGLGALDTARRALALFPQSTRTIENMALVLERFDSPEEALFLVTQPTVFRSRASDYLAVRLLHATGRQRESESFANSNQLPSPPPARGRPELAPVPAERALDWLTYGCPTEEDFAAAAAKLRENLGMTTSPFLRAYMEKWLACYAGRCAEGDADAAAWEDCGRDAREKATALNQLCLLLCREQRVIEARQVAARATELLPDSGMLWRIRVGLPRQDLEVIGQASKACPDDPEVWLAHLVSRLGGSGGELLTAANSEARGEPEWLAAEIGATVRERRFSAGTMTRAGDYLLRRGYVSAASRAADDAFERANGYLPAHVLAARCAVATRDRDRLMRATLWILNAAEEAPPAVYQTLVQLNAEQGAVDADMVNALKRLRIIDPGNPLWAELLGQVRFVRGGLETLDAMFQSDQAIELGSTNMLPFYISAEVARTMGQTDKAAELLSSALERMPGNVVTLNNLVYTLASDPATVSNALVRLPELMRAAAGSTEEPEALETEVFTCVQAGMADEASALLDRLETLVPQEGVIAFRCRIHRAAIARQKGHYQAVVDIIGPALRGSRGIPDEDIARANRILAAAREALLPARQDREPRP